jgi:hypothetical protein
MPFVSPRQQRWGHTAEGEKALGGPAKVAEWDRATKEAHMNKGYQGKSESFAQGGAVLGRTTDFMKTPDRFREMRSAKEANKTQDDFAKGSGKSVPKAGDKVLKTVKPRS